MLAFFTMHTHKNILRDINSYLLFDVLVQGRVNIDFETNKHNIDRSRRSGRRPCPGWSGEETVIRLQE